MPDIAMCDQRCPVMDKCYRHKESGPVPQYYQAYAVFKPPPEDKPEKCEGWWDRRKYLNGG